MKNEKNLCGGGYLFANQFVNDLDRAFVYFFGFRKKIINSYVGQSRNTNFPLTQPATAVRTKSNFIIGDIVAKRHRFFISHSCHNKESVT